MKCLPHKYLKNLFNLSSYSNRSGGGWSTRGIIQDSDPRSPVVCNSTHLTSFAVLVSARSEDDSPVRY